VVNGHDAWEAYSIGHGIFISVLLILFVLETVITAPTKIYRLSSPGLTWAKQRAFVCTRSGKSVTTAFQRRWTRSTIWVFSFQAFEPCTVLSHTKPPQLRQRSSCVTISCPGPEEHPTFSRATPCLRLDDSWKLLPPSHNSWALDKFLTLFMEVS
jgi:hypothetical protein